MFCKTLLNQSNYTINSCNICRENCEIIYTHPDLCITKCFHTTELPTTTTTQTPTTTTTQTPTTTTTQTPTITTTQTAASAQTTVTFANITPETNTSYSTLAPTTEIEIITTVINDSDQVHPEFQEHIEINKSVNTTELIFSNADANAQTVSKDSISIWIIIIPYVLFFCLFVSFVVYCFVKKKKKKRRLSRIVVPHNQDQVHLDIVPSPRENIQDQINKKIIAKWLNEKINGIINKQKNKQSLPSVADATKQMKALRKAKHVLLRNRRKHTAIQQLVLRNMQNKPRANPLHQHHTPLKKRLRIKEIFDDAVKLDVHGRPKSPFKEV